MLSTPDGRRLGEALAGLDFMAAVDIYVNETTRHADVILPPTTALERDHYDMVFHGARGAEHRALDPALLPKPDGRQARLGDLPRAGRCASSAGWSGRPGLRDPAQAARPAGAQPAPHRRRLLLRTSGVTTLKSCAATPRASISARCVRPCPSDSRPRTTASTSRPTWCIGDLPRLQAWLDDRLEPAPTGCVLIGRRHKQDNNAWFHNIERVNRGRPRHQLLMHPDDLAERGIADGALVDGDVPRSARSRSTCSATDDMMRGVVSLPHGYGHQVDGRAAAPAAKVPGVSINDLTDPDLLDVSGNAALSGVPVTVAPA